MALVFNQQTQQWEDNENPAVNQYLANTLPTSTGATGSWGEAPVPADIVIPPKTSAPAKAMPKAMPDLASTVTTPEVTPEATGQPTPFDLFGSDALTKIKKDAEDKYKGRYSELAIAQLFSNIGDAVAGRQIGSQNQVFQNFRDEAKQERSQAEIDFRQKQEMDPNSPESKIAQNLAKQMGFQGDVSKLTAEKWKSIGPVQSKMYEMNVEKQKNLNDAAYKKGMLDIEKQKVDVERGKIKSEMGKLNSSEKQVLSLATEGLKASKDMRTALENGDNTFALVGDNNYTESMRRYAENYGRLQSGGAINKDEEKRFLEMAPKATDSKEMQKRKLDKMEEMFRTRMSILGINPDKMVTDNAAPSQAANNPNKPKWAK